MAYTKDDTTIVNSHMYEHIHDNSNIYAHIHRYIHTNIRTHTHARTHTHIQAYMHTCMQTDRLAHYYCGTIRY